MFKPDVLFSVALYIRLSKDDGDKEESNSIGSQRKVLLNYINKERGFLVYDTYIDDGYTGTNFKRPSFERMIEDIENGLVNCVVVKDLSRFGRDYIDTGKYLERFFPSREIRFISVNDNIDSDKYTYDMLLPIKNIFNEQYSRDISKKVQSAFKAKQVAGEFIGAFASYGYKKSPSNKNVLVIDEYPASVIRNIFQLYVEGYGKQSIAQKLNDEDILCPSEYKKACGENYSNSNKLESTSYWTYSTIDKILKNEMYIGNMVQGKTKRLMKGKAKCVDKQRWVIVEGTHEPIIDRDVWLNTQKLLNINTRKLNLSNSQSVFAGFLKCGDCGRALIKKNSSLGSMTYYCGTYTRNGRKYCTPHAISHTVIEKIIIDDLNIILNETKDLKGIVNKLKSKDTEYNSNTKKVETIKQKISKIDTVKKDLYRDYKEELISKEEYLSFRNEYINKESLLLKTIELYTAKRKQNYSITDNEWIRYLLSSKKIYELDRNIVLEMIDRIHVYERDRIKIIYNFAM